MTTDVGETAEIASEGPALSTQHSCVTAGAARGLIIGAARDGLQNESAT